MSYLPAQLAALLLTGVFAWSAFAKVLRNRDWMQVVPRYRLPSFLTPATIFMVPLVEGVVPVLFVAERSRAAAALSLCLLAGFSLAVLRARRLEGDRLPCGCFGKTKVRDYRLTIVRNALLAVAAAVVLLLGRDVALLEGLGRADASDALPLGLGLVGLALLAWMLWSVSGSLRGGRS